VLDEIMPEYVALHPDVEEFQLYPDSDRWEITFRAKNPEPSNGSRGLGSVFFPFVYKVVSVSASDGSLISIKNPSNDF
jgi:hypothetical protein